MIYKYCNNIIIIVYFFQIYIFKSNILHKFFLSYKLFITSSHRHINNICVYNSSTSLLQSVYFNSYTFHCNNPLCLNWLTNKNSQHKSKILLVKRHGKKEWMNATYNLESYTSHSHCLLTGVNINGFCSCKVNQ